MSNIKEFLFRSETGEVAVEYDDGTAVEFNLADAVTHHLAVIDYLQFADNAPEPSHSEGMVFYDYLDHSLAYYNEEADVKVNIGREQLVRVYNNTASTLLNGKLVYISGANTGWPTAALAKANSKPTSESTIGMVTANIEPNSYGYVCVSGIVNDIDTSAYSAGDMVYLSADTSGEFTKVAPLQPNYLVAVGTVLFAAASGKMFVHVDRKDWHPNLELLETTATVTLPTIPTVFKPSTTVRNEGFIYSSVTGEIEILNSESYGVTITLNAEPNASNKYIYFYSEEFNGASWVINRYSARKLRLENQAQEQVVISANRYFPVGYKLRLNIWGDATVTLKSADLPGTTAGTATLPAFRLQIA